MSAKVTLQFCVPVGHEVGDYVQLFGNNGSGDIDYDTPLLNGRKFDLFPMGSGIYGCGHEPCGESPCGHPYSTRVPGCGHEPCGHSPCGLGTAIIDAEIIVATCGSYKFAFAAFDSLDNPDEGDPQEISVTVHTAPPAPTGLAKNSYDPDTDILVLDAVT
jgi:hypothetical protein